MVTGVSHKDDGEKAPSVTARGATRSWGTTVSGQSVSTSGSVGSPSSRSEAAVVTPASENTFLRLNHLDIHAGDDAGSQGAAVNKKKKRGQRAVGGDKNGRGLRQFSMKVCEKVESKGRTTYNEIVPCSYCTHTLEAATTLPPALLAPLPVLASLNFMQVVRRSVKLLNS